MSIPEIILEQMGGSRFVACTGCKNFLAVDKNTLRMTIPRNSSKANRLDVVYNAETEDYIMRFFRYTKGRFSTKKYIRTGDGWTPNWIPEKIQEIRKFDRVYCFQLRELFTEVTGLLIQEKIIVNGVEF